MWINIKTGYTFKAVYGHLDQIAKKCFDLCIDAGIKEPYGGIADLGNTFAHIPWKKACEKVGVKPIYGVQLPVTEDLQKKERRYPFNWMTMIARNMDGLQEIYELTDISFKQFYYRQRITYDQINSLSNNVFILSGVAPRWNLIKRDVYKELSPNTPIAKRKDHNLPHMMAAIDNFYPDLTDIKVYEPFADERLREKKTSPLHILSKAEWLNIFPGFEMAIESTKAIAGCCNVELKEAPMVSYNGSDCIEKWCKKSAIEKGLINKPEYIKRYKREITLIKEKKYTDYFLVVADAIRFAKGRMSVGPARGSSAGSLVCYLLGITEIDPLEYDLYFERFIDVNRYDLPDIDIDFQDDKRHLVIKYLEKKYGKDNVAQIGNINRLKPKSAITRFAQALNIPIDDVVEVKDAIMERSGGDARANFCMEDTFTDTDVGKRFIEKYPEMEVVKHIESHPSHTGVHAAGVIVCNDPITNYCGVNSRDKKRIGMLDKKDCEAVNLLKIDALGLRTLSIIAGVCDQIGKLYSWIYEIPVDDKDAYSIFNDHRYNGIFQFEGPAIQGLAKQMPVENIEDVSALTAIGRPGPMVSGGASEFIAVRTGLKPVKYLGHHPSIIKATKKTYGIIIYQEQVMEICREYGGLSWGDVDTIRRAMSKSYGDEFFDTFKKKFIEGAKEKGDTEEEATEVWKSMHAFGSYGFNKSHAVSYGLISYITAYLKAHYPLEFTVACLNHTKSDRSGLKILRDAVENDNIKYCYFDKMKSEKDWSVKDGVLYGGFTTLDGIGPKKAVDIIKKRTFREPLTPGLNRLIKEAASPFKYIYPAKELYGDYYTDPRSHGLNGRVTKIAEAEGDGKYTIIGCMIKKNLRDANEAGFVSKRGGKFLEGDTSWLNITIEDDTGIQMCKIKIQDYNRFGKDIAETGKEEHDWYMVYGNKINGWSILFVENIRKITRS